MASPFDSHSDAEPSRRAVDSLDNESAASGALGAEETLSQVEKLLNDLPSSANAATSSDLIEQTRQQIQHLTSKIKQLAQSELTQSEFYSGFLTRVTTALASQGGIVWMLEGDRLESKYQINADSVLGGVTEEDQGRHSDLLHRVIQRGQAVLVPPHSRSESDKTEDNPSVALDLLL